MTTGHIVAWFRLDYLVRFNAIATASAIAWRWAAEIGRIFLQQMKE